VHFSFVDIVNAGKVHNHLLSGKNLKYGAIVRE